MRTSIAIAAILLFQVSASYSADVIPTTSGGGFVSFGGYEPREPKSLSEIPPAVRERLAAHLKSRLGDAYYQRLKFAGGQIIDAAELLKKEPNSKNYQWEVPAYVIAYNFQLPETGVASFPATIELRKNGSVINEIGLPAFGSDSSKLTFFPFSSALLTATQQGFSRDKVEASFEYNEKFGSLVWGFDEVVSDSGATIHYKTLVMSAHTGEILWTGSTKGMH